MSARKRLQLMSSPASSDAIFRRSRMKKTLLTMATLTGTAVVGLLLTLPVSGQNGPPAGAPPGGPGGGGGRAGGRGGRGGGAPAEPAGPMTRTPDGHPDFSGFWNLPDRAGASGIEAAAPNAGRGGGGGGARGAHGGGGGPGGGPGIGMLLRQREERVVRAAQLAVVALAVAAERAQAVGRGGGANPSSILQTAKFRTRPRLAPIRRIS